MDTVKLSAKLDKCLKDIIKCHNTKEPITYTYDSLNKSFDSLMVNDIGNVYKVENQGQKFYFERHVFDNSNSVDCDVRFTFTPIDHKPIYSFDDVKDLLIKLNKDLIGDDVKSLRIFEKWLTKNLMN